MLHLASADPVGADEREVEFRFAGWRFQPGRWTLCAPTGVEVELSSGELGLLLALVERPRRVLSRNRLLELTRGPLTEVFDRAVDVQVCRLRRKLALAHPNGGGLIRTLTDAGYMLAADVAQGGTKALPTAP